MSDALGEWEAEATPEPVDEGQRRRKPDPRLRKYADNLADAGGALRVAVAKADAYEDDDKKDEWQKVAANVEVEKAERKRQRAADDLEAARSELWIIDHQASGPTDEEAEDPQPYFGSADEFVREWLCHMYSREVSGRGSGRVWRDEWWKVPEAVSRLDALWRAWEHLRLDGATGMSVWWRDHADHHMAVLLDPEGPFRGSETACRVGSPLPCAPPPEGLFPDERVAPPGVQA